MKIDPTQDPLVQFNQLFEGIRASGVPEPGAMTLSTLGRDGFPNARIVLFKGVRHEGLSFYSNYDSTKGEELEKLPAAALTFHWVTLEKQVRIRGPVFRLSRAESEEYFAGRPRLSQLGAWASMQSQRLSAMGDLQQRLREMEERFRDQEVPCPPHWGGFTLKPLEMEFWFGHEGRLHERYCFSRDSLEAGWQYGMKYP